MEGASVVDGSGCNCSLPFAFFPPPSLVVEEEADCAKKKEIGDRGYTPASSGCSSKGESGLSIV